MSERRVVEMMAQQYADMLTGINIFGDMLFNPKTTAAEFEAMRAECLEKIREQKRYLREAENQVKLLQLRSEQSQEE